MDKFRGDGCLHHNITLAVLTPARLLERELERGGLKVLSEADIWKNAEGVCKELPKCKDASGFIQAYRIAEKVIKEKGDNKFLGVGGINTNVRTDFYEIDNGLDRKY
jgi:hypothetical protein